MSNDVFTAGQGTTPGTVLPLHTITVVTATPKEMHRFLAQGIGLAAKPDITLSEDDQTRIGAYLGMPESTAWSVQAYHRGDGRGNTQVRVIGIDSPGEVVRPEVNGRYVGGLSIGFAMDDLEAREAVMREHGFESSVGVKSLEFAKPDGTRYVSQEIHFIGPEQVLGLGVKRPDGFQPVGPLDAETGVSGPAYSALCVPDADAAITFLEQVLEFEIRRDVDLTVAQPSGLRLATGMKERFVQAFAPGASTGYLVLLDHYSENIPTPAKTQGPPSRGIVMWSFPTSDLAAAYDRAKAAGASILAPPGRYDSPFLDNAESMIVQMPSGYPVELFSQ